MLYPRKLFKRLEAELEHKETTVITGMRQVGKTTALKHLHELVESENKVILDPENPLHREVFEEKNYDAVWDNLAQFGITVKSKAYLFVDEVQNLPEISRVVKYLYDHWDVKFVLTGSSSYYLKNLFPESMAGRKLIFEMFPLDFDEFLTFKKISRETRGLFAEKSINKNKIAYEKLSPLYNEYVNFGGFPAVVLEENIERKREKLTEVFTSYFEKDAKNLANFRDMSKLRDLIKILSVRVASRIDINKLASELSVSRQTVYDYLTFLEQTYFISLLPRFSGSLDRQAAGSRKLFFCDSGVAGVLGNLSEGQMLEQSVFQCLRGRHKLAFYSKGGKEIDFIVNDKVALEVKTNASRADIANLKKRTEARGLEEYYVVSRNYSEDKEVILAMDL